MFGRFTQEGFMQQEVAGWLVSRWKKPVLLALCALSCAGVLDADLKDSKPVVLALFGPPGSGRDLLAVRVSSSYCLPYISCADLLVDYSDEESDMGKKVRECLHGGAEIDDSLLLDLISDRMKRSDCDKGFLLDGFPKTVEQAKLLRQRVSMQFRFVPAYIRSSDEWLVNFHEGRLVCTNCGRVYHTDRSPPKSENECDFCEQELVKRSDDEPETLKERSESYRTKIMPLITYYREEGILVEIDGTKPLEEMLQDVKALVLR